MFNVSALLLDDALKLATPRPPTNGAISETLTFSQGSECSNTLEVWWDL